MKFYKYADAVYYKNMQLTPHKVVNCRHWSMEKWAYVPCYTVVLK